MNGSNAGKSDPSHSVDEDRIAELVKKYMTQWESGARPNRVELLGNHPQFAMALTPYLDSLDAIYGAGLTRRVPAADETALGLANGAWAQPLGDFKIVREIGRGGMGSVYEAVQLSLGRKVALKILPLAAALDERNLRRFKTEAQAAALLHHSNIVPVYAVGCERGVHYYAMQLIEGQSLADVIKQLRSQAGGVDFAFGAMPLDSCPSTKDFPIKPDSARVNGAANGSAAHDALETPNGFAVQLSTMHDAGRRDYFRTVARLIRDAALALEHAHRAGVIHRDIKPGNLLVDRTGNLWITDFGLAQFHEEIGPTRTGDLLGTLQYMSPEQASGQRVVLDARTDVYSLGATLYEMLALRPMFDGANRQAVLRQIANEDPKPVRAFDRNVPVELELIAGKATSKLPVERYATAQDLADDLESFLNDRPIRAKAPTFVDRMRKWSRRHPSIVGSTVVVLGLTAVGLMIHSSRLAIEQARTKQALVQEKQRAEEAERAFRQAREAVDLLVQVADEELRNQPPLVNVRRRLLETALNYYEDLFEEATPSAITARPSVAAAQARARKILADLATMQGAHRIGLVRDAGVQQELGLSEAQKTRLTELANRRARPSRGPRGNRPTNQAGPPTTPPTRPQRPPPSADARRQWMVDWFRKQEEELAAILTPEQSRRLDQVVLQLQGPHAFNQPQVAERLQLTKPQLDRMTWIENEAVGTMFGDLRSGRSVDADRVHEISEKATERCLRALNEQQRARWREMIGPALTIEPKLLLPPPTSAWPLPAGKPAPPPSR